MRRQLRWYGASPLHLLALLACFGLAGYAAARLVSSQPLAVAVWFLGAVIGHDLLLMPLYSLADRSAMAAIRHREPQLPATPWINYVRVPAALSGLLLLVWFPLILRLQSPYHASTTLSADPYVWHWLAVTGALFLLSAVAFALRLRSQSRTAAAAGTPGRGSPPIPALSLRTSRANPGQPGQADPGTEQTSELSGKIRSLNRARGRNSPESTDIAVHHRRRILVRASSLWRKIRMPLSPIRDWPPTSSTKRGRMPSNPSLETATNINHTI